MASVTAPSTSPCALTDTVIASGAACPDERLRAIFAALVRHLHGFVVDVGLTHEEWLAAIRFLTATGQACDDVRQEFILLSDTLGVTAMVDELAAHRTSAPGATESSLLGPFYAEDAPDIEPGGNLAVREGGVPLLVHGVVRDALTHAGVPNALVEAWGTDGAGSYDSQYDDRRVDCRGRVRAHPDGTFAFRTVVPQSYPVPTDGPVGTLLNALGRRPFRPAHLHFRIAAEGYRPLTTAIYAQGDPHLASDAVFGVRDSLIEEFRCAADAGGAPQATLQRDFAIVRA